MIADSGKTKYKVAQEAGINRQSIDGYLMGDSAPRSDKLFALAKALDVSPVDLWEGKPPAPEADVKKPHLAEVQAVTKEQPYGDDAKLVRALTQFLNAWKDGGEHHRKSLIETVERLEKSIEVSKRFTG